MSTSSSDTPSRWLALGSSALIATSVLAGPALVAAPAAPAASVQAVALTADENNLGFPDFETLTIGQALGYLGLDSDALIADFFGPFLGPFGDTDLNTLLDTFIPDFGLGDVTLTDLALDLLGSLGVTGDQTLVEAGLTILGFEQDATVVDGLGLLFGIPDLDSDVLLVDFVGDLFGL